MGFNLGKIKIGQSASSYKHDVGCDIHSTLNFKFVQPTYMLPMDGGNRINLRLRQLVRLAPLPVPSFARMRVENRGYFIPAVDVMPAFEAMRTHVQVNTSVSQYIPTTVTTVSPKFLLMYLLCNHSIMACFTQRTTEINATTWTVNRYDVASTGSSSINNCWSAFVDSLNKPLQYAYSNFHANNVIADNKLSIDGADFVYIDRTLSNGASSLPDTFAFKLTPKGKALFSIFSGLGYNLDWYNDNEVSALPLLAFYKGYFDLFAPKRVLTWSDTAAYALINYMYENGKTVSSLTNNASVSGAANFTNSFLEALGECYVTQQDDFVSVHRSTPFGGADVSDVEKRLTVPHYIDSNVDLSSPDAPDTFSQGASATSNQQGQEVNVDTSYPLTYARLKVLERLAKFVSKNSVIGRKVESYIKAHYDSTVLSSFFKDSKFVFQFNSDCSINDVMSTAQTTTSDGVGENLGAYAGKGIGFGDDKVNFEAPSFGFFIIFTNVAPKTGFYQGDDPTLYGVNRWTLPNTEFDGIGMELTPLSCVHASNGVCDKTVNKVLTSQSFGYVPRYSGFKVHKDVVAGDMALRSSQASYAPYHLERILQPCILRTNSDGTLSEITEPLPKASTSWRYPTRYNWLGDFNRLFYNDPFLQEIDLSHTTPVMNGSAASVPADNFLIQCALDCDLYSSLKPLSQSFDTVDEGEKPSMSVSAE
jgi:hypothetical protein